MYKKLIELKHWYILTSSGFSDTKKMSMIHAMSFKKAHKGRQEKEDNCVEQVVKTKVCPFSICWNFYKCDMTTFQQFCDQVEKTKVLPNFKKCWTFWQMRYIKIFSWSFKAKQIHLLNFIFAFSNTNSFLQEIQKAFLLPPEYLQSLPCFCKIWC